MKSRIVLVTMIVSVFLVGVSWAADVTGKWTAQVPGRGGQTRETTFNFKAEGDKLTGTMSSQQGEVPISDGTVKGDDIAFSVKISGGGGDIKINFKGKVAGDEIKFTRTREGADQGQEFTAKRAK
jgi:autotransporter translocation and assembly factor TamB